MSDDKQIAIRLPEGCRELLDRVSDRYGVTFTGLYVGLVEALRQFEGAADAGQLTPGDLAAHEAGMRFARTIGARNRRELAGQSRDKTQVRLSHADNEWLDGFCARHGVTKNSLMLILLLAWPDGWGDEAAHEARARQWKKVIIEARHHDGQARRGSR